MPANEIRAYCAELAHASKATTSAADEIDSRRRTLRKQMDDLARTWTGQAATAYLAIWADIDNDCGAMLADLRWIGESLASGAAAYGHMESDGARAFGSIRRPGAGGL